MGTLLKGVQSVLIALGVIAVVGTGVIVYYNTIKPPEDETAVVETESAEEEGMDIPADTGTENEESAEPADITDPAMIPLSNTGTASSVFTPENGHEHTYTSTVLRPATCTEQGEVRYECYCGDFYVDAITALEHTRGEWITVRSATTTQTGLRQRSCTLCGRTLEEETIPMLTAPADTDSNKNSNKKNDSTSDHRHTYTYEITSEATCTEKGEKTYTCTICGSTFKTSIAATNHPSRKTIRTDGDCKNDGKIETVCNICQAVVSSEAIHYEHDWGSWSITTSPTTTAAGVKTRTCKDCGEQQTRSIAMLSGGSSGSSGSGSSSSGNSSNSGSGSSSGTNTGTGTNANHKHTYTSVVTTPATCETAGVTTYTCSCGDTYTENEPEALGHKASGSWITTKVATTEEEGERVQYCSRCSKIALSQKVAKLNAVHTHNFSESAGGRTVIQTAATCTTAGTRISYCSCGYRKYTSIEALGHNWVTAPANSEALQRCNRCGEERGKKDNSPTLPDPGPDDPGPGPTPDPDPNPDPSDSGDTTTP